MIIFLAAFTSILAILFILVATHQADWTFIKDYQTLIAGLLAIGAALIAFAGALRQAQATARAAEHQIAALRQQTQDEFNFLHREAERNSVTLIRSIHAEIKAIQLGIMRREYIPLCKQIIENLNAYPTTPLPEFGFSQNYMPVLDAAAARIGELPPQIAEGVAKVGVLAKSAMDQANLVHQIGLRELQQQLSKEYKIGMMTLLLADVTALTAAIDDILPKLENHLAAMP